MAGLKHNYFVVEDTLVTPFLDVGLGFQNDALTLRLEHFKELEDFFKSSKHISFDEIYFTKGGIIDYRTHCNFERFELIEAGERSGLFYTMGHRDRFNKDYSFPVATVFFNSKGRGDFLPSRDEVLGANYKSRIDFLKELESKNQESSVYLLDKVN